MRLVEDDGETEVEEDDLDIERVVVSPDLLVESEWNPNEMDPEDFELLKEEISEVGFIDPITVVDLGVGDDKRYRVIGGAHRLAAARQLGIEKVPVDVLQGEIWADTDLQKFQCVRLNVLHGRLKPEKFVKLYNEMAEKYGQEQVGRMMGYTNEDGIRKMIRDVAKGMKESLSPEAAEKFQERAKKAQTVNDLERIIQDLFEEHGDTVEYNFMVFAWGGREHIYVAMSKRMHSAMKQLMKAAKKQEVDINELLADYIELAAQALAQEQ